MRARVVFALVISGVVAGAAAARPQSESAAEYYAVTGIDMKVDSALLAVATDITTTFGKAPIRQAGASVIVRTHDPESPARAPRYLTDPDFTLAPFEPLDRGAMETRIHLPRGYRDLAAGPDVFLIDANGTARNVVVTPVYRMPDKTLREGPSSRFDMPYAAGLVNIEGVPLYGVGIDLDAWSVRGDTPKNGELVGLVVRHDGGGGSLSLVKIFIADNLLYSELVVNEFGQDTPRRRGYQTGGGVRGGSGRGGSGARFPSPIEDPTPDEEDPVDTPEIPAPGTLLLLGAAALLGGGRRSRRA